MDHAQQPARPDAPFPDPAPGPGPGWDPFTGLPGSGRGGVGEGSADGGGGGGNGGGNGGGSGRPSRGRRGLIVAALAGVVLVIGAAAVVKLWPQERPPVRDYTPQAVTPRTLTTPGPCLPRPSRCGFPDASTTGYAHTGVQPAAYDGPYTIDEPGTVIDGKLIRAGLVIKADNVTIRRSFIQIAPEDADHDLAAIRVREGVRNTLIEDVQVDGGGMGIGIELAGANGVALRTDVSHTLDYFRGNSGSVIEASYGHDAATVQGGHSDGFQSLGAGDLALVGNTLVLPYGNDVNSVVTIGSDFATPADVRIEGNLLAGGGWTVSLAQGTGIVVRGNRIARSFGYGPLSDKGSATWSGNVWDDTRAAIPRA